MAENSPRRTPIIALFVASLISVTGEALAALAIPWFVLETTHSPAQTGVTAFVSITPIVLATFFGGALVDRAGYKRVAIAADLASGLTIALIPVLYNTVGLEFWQLLVLVFLTNLLDAPGMTARAALLPELAEQAALSLERATALDDGVSRATRMIGAPLAGVLIAVLGAVNILWLDAISFFVSALIIGIFVRSSSPERIASEKTNYWDDLRAGIQFIHRDALIVTIIIAVMLTNLLDTGFGAVFLPVYSARVYGTETGSIQLGLLLGVFGGGALLGTVLMSLLGERLPRRWLLAGGFGITGLRWFLLAVYPPLWMLLLLMGVLGLAVGPLNPVISTVLLEKTPSKMRARVLGATHAGAWVAMPLGGLLAGSILEWMPLSTALLIYGVSYLSVAAALGVAPSLATIDSGRNESVSAVMPQD